MKVLVTGGTGFIGSYMSKYLDEKGYDVTICDNNFRGKIDDFISGIKIIQIDLTDRLQLEKLDTDYDCVYHFAAVNGTENFYNIPHIVLRTNALSNINILDWCVDNNIKKVLSTSSSEVYCANKEIEIPTSENVEMTIDDIYNPRFSYSGSKIFGELLFVNYNKMYDMNVKIVRPHNIYGPRMGFEHVIPQITKRIVEKENPFTIYGARQTRSFCYIKDAIRQMNCVMEYDSDNMIYNVGSEKEVLIKDLVHNMFNICKYQPESIVNQDAPKGSVERRCPDMSLLKSQGFYQEYTNIEDGLEETCKWYMEFYNNV
tara:strand:- start:1542 stop:2486 length:945 start_codon:yes stop_codon:yes gene_type:complete